MNVTASLVVLAWTQNCLFRGLLAYAGAAGDERVYTAVKRAAGFGFVPKTVAGTNPDYPLDHPLTVLEGELIGKDGKPVPATLVPIGAKSAQLRLVTFPIKNRINNQH